MHCEVELVEGEIRPGCPMGCEAGMAGAVVEFSGRIRGEEAGRRLRGLHYEAYPAMAHGMIERMVREVGSRHSLLAARVVHRVGFVPVGEEAIYVAMASSHRKEAFRALDEFMDLLKQNVPIWKSATFESLQPE